MQYMTFDKKIEKNNSNLSSDITEILENDGTIKKDEEEAAADAAEYIGTKDAKKLWKDLFDTSSPIVVWPHQEFSGILNQKISFKKIRKRWAPFPKAIKQVNKIEKSTDSKFITVRKLLEAYPDSLKDVRLIRALTSQADDISKCLLDINEIGRELNTRTLKKEGTSTAGAFFLEHILARSLAAVPFLFQALLAGVAYSAIYSNLIFATVSVIAYFVIGAAKMAYASKEHMIAKYNYHAHLLKKCAQRGTITKENGKYTNSIEIEKIDNILAQTWYYLLHHHKQKYAFRNLNKSEIMECHINMRTALIKFMLRRNKFENPLNYDGHLSENTILLFGKILIDHTYKRFNGRIRFNDVPDSTLFENGLLKIYTTLKGESSLTKMNYDETSNYYDILVHALINRLYIGRTDTFTKVYHPSTEKEDLALSKIMKSIGNKITKKAGDNENSTILHILTFIEHYLVGVPIFNNLGQGIGLLAIIAAICALVVGLTKKMRKYISRKRTSHKKQYDLFKNNLKSIFKQEKLEVEIDNTHHNARDIRIKNIQTRSMFKLTIYLIARVWKELLEKHQIENIDHAFSAPNQAFITLQLFNSLSVLIKAENKDPNDFEMSKSQIEKFVKKASEEINSQFSLKKKVKFSQLNFKKVVLKSAPSSEVLNTLVEECFGDRAVKKLHSSTKKCNSSVHVMETLSAARRKSAPQLRTHSKDSLLGSAYIDLRRNSSPSLLNTQHIKNKSIQSINNTPRAYEIPQNTPIRL